MYFAHCIVKVQLRTLHLLVLPVAASGFSLALKSEEARV